MNYAEIRQHVAAHFREQLERFKAGVDEAGPIQQLRRDALAASQGLAGGSSDDWAALVHTEGESGLLRDFCAARGIAAVDITADNRLWLLDALRQGHMAFTKAALGHADASEQFDLELDAAGAAGIPTRADERADEPSASYQDVITEYLTGLDRLASLAPKTGAQKREVLALLGEITEQKPVADLTKADARHVKDVLSRYPKNRQKVAATKGKALSHVIDMPGIERISPSTIKTYLSHMREFLTWAKDHGHAVENIFDGITIKSKRSKVDQRDAFSTDQLNRLYQHLTDNPMLLVKTDAAKWGSLIGMFTGMRLNEIAQLETADIKQIDGIWCIDVSDVGEGTTKRLKTAAADRRVPLHARLRLHAATSWAGFSIRSVTRGCFGRTRRVRNCNPSKAACRSVWVPCRAA